MDQSRFDDIARVLAARSRRSLLGIAGAAALTALFGVAETDAKKKKCKKPKIKCKKKCVNPKTDSQNCGGCGVTCTGDLKCINGKCACADSSRTKCETACVDLQTDEEHCGTCGKPCGAGQTCVDGGCVGGGCGPGLGQCAPSDLVACHTCCGGGAGDDGCPGNQVCGSGAVRCECEKPGFAVVPGCGSNCVCGPTCQTACAPDWTCCPEVGCRNLMGCGPNTNGCNGQQQCGTCDNACSELETCCLGVCRNLSAEGLTHCPTP